MLPYAFLLLFPAITSNLYFGLKTQHTIHGINSPELIHKRNRITIILFFFGFFLLLSLRDITVGSDLGEYEIIFDRCKDASLLELFDMKWEPGFTLYCRMISWISKEYRVFLIVTAMVVLYPIYVLYASEKKYSYLLIVLFVNMPCFLIIFSGLRQAIAISIGILAYLAMEKREHIRCVALILLAISFHTSAFVLILLYVAKLFKIKSKHLLCIVPILILFFGLRNQIFSVLLTLTPNKYVEFYGGMQQTGAVGMLLLFLLFNIFSFVILDESVMSERDYFMRNLLFISLVFQFFVPIHGHVQRASYYFLIFTPVSILRIVQAPKRKIKNVSNVAVIVLSCFFTLYFFYNAAFSNDNLLGVFPYKFFWGDSLW